MDINCSHGPDVAVIQILFLINEVNYINNTKVVLFTVGNGESSRLLHTPTKQYKQQTTRKISHVIDKTPNKLWGFLQTPATPFNNTTATATQQKYYADNPQTPDPPGSCTSHATTTSNKIIIHRQYSSTKWGNHLGTCTPSHNNDSNNMQTSRKISFIDNP